MPDDRVYGEPPSSEDVAALVAVLGVAMDRYIKNRARRTIFENAKADPAEPKCRWVVEADACDFCKARGGFWFKPGEMPAESHGGCKCHPEAGCYRGRKPKYKKLDDSDIAELQMQSDEIFSLLSTDQRNAINGYTLDDYTDINRVLFDKAAGIPSIRLDEVRKSINSIDSVFPMFQLGKDCIVWKGAPAKHYEGWKRGSIKPFNGYFSSSTKEGVANGYYRKALQETGNAIMIEIRLPKEISCLYIGANTNAAEGNEFELLLARGAKLCVIEKTKKKMVLEVIVE